MKGGKCIPAFFFLIGLVTCSHTSSLSLSLIFLSIHFFAPPTPNFLTASLEDSHLTLGGEKTALPFSCCPFFIAMLILLSTCGGFVYFPTFFFCSSHFNPLTTVGKLANLNLSQRLPNALSKGPESKYFQLCRPDGLCSNYPSLQSRCESSHRQGVNE